MRKWKVGAATMIAFVLLGAAVAAWLLPSREKLALELRFLRYTNEVWTIQTAAGPTMSVYSPLALMQASNSGNRPLELLNVMHRTNALANDFARPLTQQFPITINPGTSAIVRTHKDAWHIEFGEPRHGPWRTGLAYRREGASTGFRGRLWALAGKVGRQWLSGLGLPPPNYYWANSGLITNPLPYIPKRLSPTNYFLPPTEPPPYRAGGLLLTNFPPNVSLQYDTGKR